MRVHRLLLREQLDAITLNPGASASFTYRY